MEATIGKKKTENASIPTKSQNFSREKSGKYGPWITDLLFECCDWSTFTFKETLNCPTLNWWGGRWKFSRCTISFSMFTTTLSRCWLSLYLDDNRYENSVHRHSWKPYSNSTLGNSVLVVSNRQFRFVVLDWSQSQFIWLWMPVCEIADEKYLNPYHIQTGDSASAVDF